MRIVTTTAIVATTMIVSAIPRILVRVNAVVGQTLGAATVMRIVITTVIVATTMRIFAKEMTTTTTMTKARRTELQNHRFVWVTEANHAGSHSSWDDISNPTGGEGTWNLCGANLPYPYLRYDNVLEGYNVANGADVPAGRCHSTWTKTNLPTKTTPGAWSSGFPDFWGRR